MPGVTVQRALEWAATQLADTSTTPGLDAQVLLSVVSGLDRTALLVRPETILPAEQHRTFCALVGRRRSGEPLAYLTGSQEFYGRRFHVDTRVLIPRPETELLVDHALSWIDARKVSGDSGVIRVLDIGTGSGCIPITLACERAVVEPVAGDISDDALAVARANAVEHNVSVDFRSGSLFEPFDGDRFDLIVSNPPYVTMERVDVDSPESSSLRFEPQHALYPMGPDAFALVDEVVRGAREHLLPGGALLVEIGDDQGQRALGVAAEVFADSIYSIQKDLAGRDRLLVVHTEPVY